MYIEKEDYKGRINAELLDLATDEDPDILAYCNHLAQDTILGYTGHIYDMATELTKSGLQRNFQVLAWALSIAVYHIYLRLPDIEIPDKISKDHDKVITDLESISKGKHTINMPSAPEPDESNDSSNKLRRIGSVKPRTHRI